MTATLKPLDPAPVKEVRLDTVHKIIEIAPGVKFSAWTFGDQVPGPTIRARVGDRIRFKMTNRSDEAVPGVRRHRGADDALDGLPRGDGVAAGQVPLDRAGPDDRVRVHARTIPGVFMYHCGTPMILEHIASGMYGAVVVEPRGGYPTKADREYVVIQSEFYAKPDPDRRKVDGAPLHVLDGDRLRAAQPTHTVFNGVHNGMVKKPLAAKAGERVRLYVLNVGPSKTSSFHVVGTIFDRVWIEGNPDNQFRGMQTVLLGSSNSAIVEFLIPEDGAYIMVDHHFANASQGAIGLISTTAKPDEADLEHHNIPATPTPTDPAAVQGKLDFESKCLACHSVGQGRKLGPDLAGVTKRRRRRVARALAEGSGEDAGDRSRREGDAEGVQQPPDAEPEPVGRRGPAVPPVLPLVRRAAGGRGDFERPWPLMSSASPGVSRFLNLADGSPRGSSVPKANWHEAARLLA